nr:probable pectinesterase/pectinesterase inhibitor 61 [Ipomoea trifida]
MGYDRLGSERGGSSRREILQDGQSNEATSSSRRKSTVKVLVIIAAVLIVTAAVSVGVLVGVRGRGSGDRITAKPSQAMARTCGKTLYPSLCLSSLLDFPGALSASDGDLVHISVNVTLQRVGKALYTVTDYNNLQMSTIVRSAYDDCLELLEDSMDLLDRSLSSILSGAAGANAQDVMTWLSAALTNQDTCTEGFSDANGPVKDQVAQRLKDLSELVSNSLAIFAATNGGDDFSGVPIQHRRKLLLDHRDAVLASTDDDFPKWLSESDRKLLSTPVTPIHADIIVAKDGTGTVKTITEAIKKVPEHSTRRIVIYIKAGVYDEANLKVGKKKTNVMIVGDGKGKTVISGGRSVAEQFTTFHTASFAATGTGFIAKDITFQNTAGPSKHQAVALRIGADHGVIYNCQIIGYQDTLYVHSQRQFYRECDIYGTVDFIFGNAAVVLQKCNIYAQKPMSNQKNTITAQNRKDPNQNTGISIHASNIRATSDLEASKGSIPTFLGRPWKMYSRTVYMLCYMGDHIHPRGWLEWNGNFALSTLYYGEYMNTGPGAGLAGRVKWPGYRVIKLETEANKFTVSQFIYGSAWLPSTGVAFLSGLSR